MKSPAVSATKRPGIGSGTGFALGCGCKDAKSVSVSASPSSSATTGSSKTTTRRRRSGAGTTTTGTPTMSASSSSLWEDAVAELRCKSGDGGRQEESSATTPSFSGLLRELSELEKSVLSWGAAARKVHCNGEKKKHSPPPREEHRKKAKGDFRLGVAKEKEHQAAAGLESSVAVVKQSDDPLGDFRRSMLQLVVENGIVSGEDLRAMLHRFLALNAPRHHGPILRAFAEVWDGVFVAASLDCAATPGRGPASRRAPGVTRTPPRHRRSPPAWRV